MSSFSAERGVWRPEFQVFILLTERPIAPSEGVLGGILGIGGCVELAWKPN